MQLSDNTHLGNLLQIILAKAMIMLRTKIR